MNFDDLKIIKASLLNKIALLCARTAINSSNDKQQEQQVSLFEGETQDVERWEQYGFASRPREGLKSLVIAVGGNRSDLASIATQHDNKPPLEFDEVIMYHREGNFIKINSQGISIEGDVTVNGDVFDMTGSLDQLRQTYTNHTHIVPQAPSGTTMSEPPQR